MHVKRVVFTVTKIEIVDYIHNGMMIPKKKFNKPIILPIVLYGREILSLTLRQGRPIFLPAGHMIRNPYVYQQH